MKFGKVIDQSLLNSIDWNLPAPLWLKKESSKPASTKIYFGSTGWGEKSWIGRLYPPKTKMQDYLKFYSQHFNSVELNTTHYREPEIDSILKWRSQVPVDFKFCPKIYKLISHYGGMNNPKVVQNFFDKCKYFEENLGVIFLQVSDSFAINRMQQLERFIEYVPEGISVAIEVRHESWFPLKESFLNLLAFKNISLVIDDVAGRRDVLHNLVIAESLMIRFVGNDLHNSDFQRIDNWFNQFKLLNKNINSIYFFIHQPGGIKVPETLEYINSKL